MTAIEEAIIKHRQEKAMIEKRVAGDQQRLCELDAIITALEAIPAAATPNPGEATKATNSRN